MASEDGITWSEAGQDTPLSYLIPFTQTGDAGQAWAVSEDGWLVSSSDLISWTRVQQLPQTFPDMDMTGICYPLRTNSSIIRYIIAGIDTDRKATHASLWTKLSNEQYWTEVETANGHSLYCPAFENLAMISYDANLLALGARSVTNGPPPTPSHGINQSTEAALIRSAIPSMTTDASGLSQPERKVCGKAISTVCTMQTKSSDNTR